jgi:hypothetical protein
MIGSAFRMAPDRPVARRSLSFASPYLLGNQALGRAVGEQQIKKRKGRALALPAHNRRHGQYNGARHCHVSPAQTRAFLLWPRFHASVVALGP